MKKLCISCGMPMEKPEDFAGGDLKKDWCCHCATADGSLKTYEEALAGMAEFMTTTQGIAEEAARDAAKSYMQTMPAWKDTGNSTVDKV